MDLEMIKELTAAGERRIVAIDEELETLAIKSDVHSKLKIDRLSGSRKFLEQVVENGKRILQN